MKKVAVVYWSGTGNTEAMAGAVAEGVKKGDIVQVYQKGYMYKQRVLRAAMVVVAK